jgi:hypothetical protein
MMMMMMMMIDACMDEAASGMPESSKRRDRPVDTLSVLMIPVPLSAESLYLLLITTGNHHQPAGRVAAVAKAPHHGCSPSAPHNHRLLQIDGASNPGGDEKMAVPAMIDACMDEAVSGMPE